MANVNNIIQSIIHSIMRLGFGSLRAKPTCQIRVYINSWSKGYLHFQNRK